MNTEILRDPPRVPRLLSLFRALRFVDNPLPILEDNRFRFGRTYRFHIGGVQPGIVTSDAAVIQHVLQKNHRNYTKSSIQRDILARYVGNGLLTAEGAFWLRQRRLIQPGFHRERLNDLASLMHQEILRFMDGLQAQIHSGRIVDVHQAMHQLTFRVVAKTLFSTSVDDSQLTQLSSDIATLQQFIVKLIRQPYVKWWHRLLGNERQHLELAEKVRSLVKDIVITRKLSEQSGGDLLQMLLESRYQDTGEAMDEDQIVDESLIIFLAGHETSANALTWALHLIASDKAVYHSVLDQVTRVKQIVKLKFGQLEQLSEIKYVLEEAMRLYPPAWILDRVAKSDDQVAGWRIPKNTVVFLNIYGLHHDEQYWPQPYSFQPKRFLVDTASRQNPRYVPFGSGPRLCIGNQFAMMEMQLVLAHLLARFEIRPVLSEVEIKPLITLQPRNGLKLFFQFRG